MRILKGAIRGCEHGKGHGYGHGHLIDLQIRSDRFLVNNNFNTYLRAVTTL